MIEAQMREGGRLCIYFDSVEENRQFANECGESLLESENYSSWGRIATYKPVERKDKCMKK